MNLKKIARCGAPSPSAVATGIRAIRDYQGTGSVFPKLEVPCTEYRYGVFLLDETSGVWRLA
jgi:hypothetical protein